MSLKPFQAPECRLRKVGFICALSNWIQVTPKWLSELNVCVWTAWGRQQAGVA